MRFWLVVVVMVVSVLHFDVGTGLILLLYLMWLSVATTLNFSICATTVNRGKEPPRSALRGKQTTFLRAKQNPNCFRNWGFGI
ncbi:MAG: hypothetical protein WCC61_14020 [Pseudomonas sp.]